MELSYCGKKCEECKVKEETKCKGCREDSDGASNYCDIAKCCMEKYVGTCYQCDQRVTCATFKKSEMSASQIAERQQNIEKTKSIEEENRRKDAALFSNAFKWMFFAMIGLYVIEVLLGFCRVGVPLAPQMASVALVVLAVLLLATLAIGILIVIQLKRISRANDSLKTAFISCIVTIALEVVSGVAMLFNASTLSTIVSLGSVVASIVYMISFWNGCRYLVEPYDYALSENWRTLWKWLVFPAAGFVVSAIVGILVPIFLIVLILAALALMVFPILQLVLMWRTSKVMMKTGCNNSEN